MKIPVYIVMGFLDAGKSTLIETISSQPENQSKQILLVSFEEGENTLEQYVGKLVKISFDGSQVERNIIKIEQSIADYISTLQPDEIWVEWNGFLSFSYLEVLLLESTLKKKVFIQNVIYVARESMLRAFIDKTGDVPIEQIQNSTLGYVSDYKGKSLLNKMNPEMVIFSKPDMRGFLKAIYQKKIITTTIYFFLSCILMGLVITTPILEQFGQSTERWRINFVGIMLQALPFLVIGVLLSSFIQVYVSRESLEKLFLKKHGMGVLVAIGMGFCVPVCDCTSIPVFKSLVKKGVPLPLAIIFMTVSPVINPVVLLSTYYAFEGDLTMVLLRAILGMICSVIIGISFYVYAPKNYLKSNSNSFELCNCGCNEIQFDGKERMGKLYQFLRHSQGEFFLVCKYLMYGTAISVFLQMFKEFGLDYVSSNHTIEQVALMMLLAFSFSLCSSSDAIIAKSYVSFVSGGGILAFLIFGPMMDLKNVMMLSSTFSRTFILRLLFTTFVVCFFIISIVFSTKIGGILL